MEGPKGMTRLDIDKLCIVIVAIGALIIGGIIFGAHMHQIPKPKTYLTVVGREIVKEQRGSYNGVDLVSPQTGLKYTAVMGYECRCDDPITGHQSATNCPYPTIGSSVEVYQSNDEYSVFDVWQAIGPRELHSEFILSPDTR